MKRNFKYYSTYIKLLYKGILNNSYQPKVDCALYRGTKLEIFEINYLKELLMKKNSGKEIPIIYSTSFLSFSTKLHVSKELSKRRILKPERNIKYQIIEEPSTEEESSNKIIQGTKAVKEQTIKKIAQNMPVINIKKQNIKLDEPKNIKKSIKNKALSKGKYKIYQPLWNVFQPAKQKNKSIKKNNLFIKVNEQNINTIMKEFPEPVNSEVIIKVNPLKERDKDKIMISNGFLNQISYFHQEDEVLFFPFSSFELNDIYTEDLKLFIVLDYSYRFLRKIDNCVFQIN